MKAQRGIGTPLCAPKEDAMVRWTLLFASLTLVACSGTTRKPCTGKNCAGAAGMRASATTRASKAADAGGNDPFGNTNPNASSVTPLDASGTTPSSTSTCADVEVRADRVIPTVILVIDQSGSMNDPFGSAGTRWNVLRDFLLKDPNGLI